MNVFVSDEQDRPVDVRALRDLAERVLVAEGFDHETELAVMLVGRDQMTEYNLRFMEGTGPTDVLAFPVETLEPGTAPVRFAGDPPLAVGDVFLCPEEIERRAAEDGVGYTEHLHLLLVHGILHTLGYHHDDDTAAEFMERREAELLSGHAAAGS